MPDNHLILLKIIKHFMKVNYRRKDKWVKTAQSTGNDWYSESRKTAKVERREKHQNKNKRLHQYHQFRELFDDDSI